MLLLLFSLLLLSSLPLSKKATTDVDGLKIEEVKEEEEQESCADLLSALSNSS